MERRAFFYKLSPLAIAALLVSCHSQPQGNDNRKAEDNSPIQLRVAAYNVLVSQKASAREIGSALKPYDLDIACFSEAPGGDWTKNAGAALGLKHVVVGKHTTAGHADKYKSIASRTPLYDYEEILMADTLHTVTKATTQIKGREVDIYSAHFPHGWRDQAHIDETANKIEAFLDYLKEKDPNRVSIVMGDFNFRPSKVETENDYHQRFVEIGIDMSWNELDIDIEKSNTHNALKPEDDGSGKVIDHIMYSTVNVEALDGGIIDLDPPLSDHKPVWALLQLK